MLITFNIINKITDVSTLPSLSLSHKRKAYSNYDIFYDENLLYLYISNTNTNTNNLIIKYL